MSVHDLSLQRHSFNAVHSKPIGFCVSKNLGVHIRSAVVMGEGGWTNCNVNKFSTMHFGMVPRTTYGSFLCSDCKLKNLKTWKHCACINYIAISSRLDGHMSYNNWTNIFAWNYAMFPLELLIGTRESKDLRVQAGLASPSPLQRTRTRAIKAKKLLYWTRESTGTRESKVGESTSPKSWTRSSSSSHCLSADFPRGRKLAAL